MADKTIPTFKILRGSVGIGTATPASKLHVASGHITLSNNYAVMWEDGNNLISGSGSSGSNHLNFNTSGSERMRIIANGNVGIGTTAPANTLEVVAPSYEGIRITAPTVPTLQLKRSASTVSNGNIEWLDSGNAVEWDIRANWDGAGTFDIREGATARLYIKSGNIGIGTNAPGSAWWTNTRNVHVSGSVAAGFFLTNTTSALEFNMASDTGGGVYFDIHKSTDAADNFFCFSYRAHQQHKFSDGEDADYLYWSY